MKAKKLLALLLVMCMALSLFAGLPMSAGAANFELTWPAADGWEGGTAPDWALNATVEEQQATIQAIYDEFDRQAALGFDMGTMNGGLTAWGNMVNVQFENGDQTGNPWGQEGRRMGGIVSPYPGMAFSVKGDMAKGYGLIALENQTTWTNPGGANYIVQVGSNTESLLEDNDKDGVYENFYSWGWHAGSGATNEAPFHKVVAMAAAGQLTGEPLNIGYVPGDAVKAANGTIEWQEFRGDENLGGYGAFETGIAIVAMKVGGSEAYLVADDMLKAWSASWTGLGENANNLNGVDLFSVTGAPTANAVTVDGVTTQAFENGTMTAEGFVVSDTVMAGRVTALIEALPAADAVALEDSVAIEAARAAYDALTDAQKALVDTEKLIAAEEALEELVNSVPEEVTAMIQKIAGFEVTYKSRKALAALRAEYEAMDAELKAQVTNAADLAAKEALFKAIIDAYTWTPKYTQSSANGITINPWVATFTEAQMADTLADIADTAKYAYYNGRRITRDTTGTDFGNFDNWETANFAAGGWLHYKAEWGPDNYNMQEYRSQFMVFAPVFPGMAFAVDSTLLTNFAFKETLAVGEPFEADGKTYQVMWNSTRFYNTTDPVGGATTGPNVVVYNWHPDESISATEPTNKNIFRYAYAKYSSDNRWEGLTYGAPQSDWATAVDALRYQKFVGPQGVAYLLTTEDQIAAAPTDVTAATYAEEMAKSYYALTGDLAVSFDENLDKKPEVLAAAGDLVSASDTAVVFANGILTKDGYTAYGDLLKIGNTAAQPQSNEDGTVNITWNASVTWNDTITLDDINANVTFTEFGAYYGTSALAVDTLASGEDAEGQARLRAFAKGEDCTVYTVFGLRLTGAPEGATRAAKFYIKFVDATGTEHTILSDAVVANEAEAAE